MPKYVLGDILRVRNLRLSKAERELQQARRLLAEAKENEEKAKKVVEDYKIFIVSETDRLYNNIIKKQVRRGAVDDLHYELQVLKNRLVDYEKNVENAEADVHKAEQNCVEKRKVLDDANKNVEKLNSHKDVWMAEAIKQEEAAEDKELEEFPGKSAKKS